MSGLSTGRCTGPSPYDITCPSNAAGTQLLPGRSGSSCLTGGSLRHAARGRAGSIFRRAGTRRRISRVHRRRQAIGSVALRFGGRLQAMGAQHGGSRPRRRSHRGASLRGAKLGGKASGCGAAAQEFRRTAVRCAGRLHPGVRGLRRGDGDAGICDGPQSLPVRRCARQAAGRGPSEHRNNSGPARQVAHVERRWNASVGTV